MGDVAQVRSDEFVAWTGGEPLANWSARKNAATVTTHETPNQLRADSVTAAQKSFIFRSTGLLDKFKETDDLKVFSEAVWEHMVDTGMDSIAYLPDPADATKMLNVVTYHSRFTLDNGRTAEATLFASSYDSYDKSNAKCAKKYLLDSLDKALATQVRQRITDSDLFATVWLQMVQSVTSVSIERFDDTKRTLKARRPQSYSGQNIIALSTDFLDDAVQLETAGVYDHNLTLAMVKSFLTAGGDDNESFRFPLRVLKTKLDEALLHIRFMAKKDADAHIITEKLTFRDICRIAESEYKLQKDRGEWPPARNTKDGKAPPRGYGAINNMEAATGDPPTLTRAEVLNLIAQGQKNRNDNNKGNGNGCFNCGDPDHYARNCPKRKAYRPANSKKQSRGSPWKKQKPKAGEPETVHKHGKTFHWCETCGRWTASHGTKDHKGKKGNDGEKHGKDNGANEANLAAIPHPYCFTLEVERGPQGIQRINKHVRGGNDHRCCGGRCHRNSPEDRKHPAPPNPRNKWYLGLIMSLIGGIMLGTLAHKLVPDVSPIVTMAGVVLKAANVFLRHHYLLAPLLWVATTALLVMQPSNLFNQSDSEPPLPKLTRQQARRMRKYTKRAMKNKRRPTTPSIRTCGLHKKYPIKLRSRGHFVNRRPLTLTERVALQENERQQDAMVDAVRKAKLERQRRWTPQHQQQYDACVQRSAHNMRMCDSWTRRKPPQPRNRIKPNRQRLVTACMPYRHQWTHRRQGMELEAASRLARNVQLFCTVTSPEGSSKRDLLRIAMQAPQKFRHTLPKESTFPVIWDSGASVCISPDRDDFVGTYSSPPSWMKLKGLAEGLKIEGIGHVALGV